jgi:hypothetical protein
MLLTRCLSAHRVLITDVTRQATKDILFERMESARRSLRSLAESQPTLKHPWMQEAMRTTLQTFTRVVDREIVRVTSEVDLMAASATGAAEIAGSQSPGMVFHGPVGVVQTGPGSFGVAVQHIDQTATDAIRKALDEITTALSAGIEEPSFNVQDVSEMVEQSRAELDKTKPNAPKLVAMLSGIGSVISYVPKLRAAYETLKWALAFVGVTLP